MELYCILLSCIVRVRLSYGWQAVQLIVHNGTTATDFHTSQPSNDTDYN